MEPIKIIYICDIEKKEIIGNFPKGKDIKIYNEKVKSILNSGNFSENKLLNEEDEKNKIFNIQKNKSILYIIISEKNFRRTSYFCRFRFNIIHFINIMNHILNIILHNIFSFF